jgi:hypothetical protein
MAVKLEINASVTEPDSSPSKVLVSEWLKARADSEAAVIGRPHNAPAVAITKPPVAHSHTYGGGWCDTCGCWMHHGSDPNGTPQSEIGHPSVCVVGGVPAGNCWSHQYTYCFSSSPPLGD